MDREKKRRGTSSANFFSGVSVPAVESKTGGKKSIFFQNPFASLSRIIFREIFGKQTDMKELDF